jgi:TrmH family RNA methyltransferase
MVPAGKNETLQRIRVVLVGTTHPGNIGGVARAMKTMGLSSLVLVAPAKFPHDEATARAAGANDVVDGARVCATFSEAIADCGLVLATSARPRTIAWPCHDVRAAAQLAVTRAARTPVAIVFGPERVGLTNEQLDQCTALVQIPANPDYSSLNLAAAAQVLCYELRVAVLQTQGGANHALGEHTPAPAADLERFYEHLRTALVQLEFLDPDNPRQLMRRLRRLFNRAQPDTIEINMLRGMLAAIQAQRRKCADPIPSDRDS